MIIFEDVFKFGQYSLEVLYNLWNYTKIRNFLGLTRKEIGTIIEFSHSLFSPGSERFYHNKNQIFFNKSCCYGPLLDPDKVSQLPEATPPGKVSSVIRTGLEMVAKAAFDPEKVIDLMQEGCGVRVVVKHKGKILKKVRKKQRCTKCPFVFP